MKKRLEALEKIERLQKQLHDLAVWRLNALGRERDELAENHREMWEALGRGVAAYGPPAAAAMRHIRALERQIAAAEAEVEAQTRRAIDQGARAKLADRARESVDARYREQRQRKELADLIEDSLRNPKSSSA
jgi:acetyl-CoA carboxylase carboxyltransferase component